MAAHELPCWAIMQCDDMEDCPAGRQAEDPNCWEIASEFEDFRSAFNICKDCVVYLVKHERQAFTEQELENIMAVRGECILATKRPAPVSI